MTTNSLALARPARRVNINTPVQQALATAANGVIRYGGKEYKLPQGQQAQEKFVVALMKTGKPPGHQGNRSR